MRECLLNCGMGTRLRKYISQFRIFMPINSDRLLPRYLGRTIQKPLKICENIGVTLTICILTRIWMSANCFKSLCVRLCMDWITDRGLSTHTHTHHTLFRTDRIQRTFFAGLRSFYLYHRLEFWPLQMGWWIVGDAAIKTVDEIGGGWNGWLETMGRENGSQSMDGIQNGTEFDSGGCVCAMKTRWKKSKRTVRTTDRCDRLAPNNKYLMISSGFA